uniref:Uncharacterized protein n=1 Tax=Anguilla anguilla TaxID=7936 RepID=A0A0E9T6E1_ANGAN
MHISSIYIFYILHSITVLHGFSQELSFRNMYTVQCHKK